VGAGGAEPMGAPMVAGCLGAAAGVEAAPQIEALLCSLAIAAMLIFGCPVPLELVLLLVLVKPANENRSSNWSPPPAFDVLAPAPRLLPFVADVVLEDIPVELLYRAGRPAWVLLTALLFIIIGCIIDEPNMFALTGAAWLDIVLALPPNIPERPGFAIAEGAEGVALKSSNTFGLAPVDDPLTGGGEVAPKLEGGGADWKSSNSSSKLTPTLPDFEA